MKKTTKVLSLMLAVLIATGSIAFAAPAIKDEFSPPLSITPASTMALGNSGWYTSDIIYDVSASDSLSGIKSVTYSTDGPSGSTVSGNVALSSGKGTITLSKNGSYNMNVVATDFAGNTKSLSLGVKLDKELPTITNVKIEDVGPLTRIAGGAHNQKVRITTTASDGVSGLRRIGYKLDGDDEYIWLADGVNNFVLDRSYSGNVTIVAQDVAGNLSAPSIVTDLIVEDEAPVISLGFAQTPNANGWFGNDAVVNIGVVDNGINSGIKSVTYTTDEATAQTGTVPLSEGSGTVIMRNNGTYKLTVTATDNAGNIGTKSIEINVDKEIPVISKVTLTDVGPLMRMAGGAHNQKVKVAVTSSDAVSGVAKIGYKIGTGSYTYLAPGTNEFILDEKLSDNVTIVAVDHADNTSDPYVIESLVIEDTAPTLDISYGVAPNADGWHHTNVTVNVQASDDGDVVSGIQSVTYTTDETTKTQTGTVNLTGGVGTIVLSNEGVYTLKVTATDKSGNTTVKTLHIKLDKTPPVLDVKASVESNGVMAEASTDQIKVAVDTTADEQNPDITAIALKLQVNKVEKATLGTDADLIDNVLNGNTLPPMYLDINLIKALTKSDATNTEEKMQQVKLPIDISVMLDDNLADKQDYSVIRVHNGKVDTLPATVKDNMLTFSTDRFSSYAIVYNEKENKKPSNGGSSISLINTKISAGKMSAKDIKLEQGWTASAVIPYCTVDGKEIIAPISMLINFKAKFVAPVTAEYQFKNNYKEFGDITDHWASDNVQFVVARELFGGIAPKTFAPEISMTRAMFVTVLARLERANVSTYSSSTIEDVANDAWYQPYVCWAVSNGVANGVGNNHFEPDRVITREEMAVMLQNYIEYKGVELETVNNNTTLIDQGAIAPWAREAVSNMLHANVINGRNDNSFDPQANATRAEVATLIRNLIAAILR